MYRHERPRNHGIRKYLESNLFRCQVKLGDIIIRHCHNQLDHFIHESIGHLQHAMHGEEVPGNKVDSAQNNKEP